MFDEYAKKRKQGLIEDVFKDFKKFMAKEDNECYKLLKGNSSK